jgi:non-ribosomal peptide synthetase component F
MEIPRDTSRNPLFDVLFLFNTLDADTISVLDSAPVRETGIPGLKIKPYEGEDKQVKFDILFTGRETGEGKNLFFKVEYSTGLFKKETMERFIDYFKEVAAAVIENESLALKDIVISHDLSLALSDAHQAADIDFDF